METTYIALSIILGIVLILLNVFCISNVKKVLNRLLFGNWYYYCVHERGNNEKYYHVDNNPIGEETELKNIWLNISMLIWGNIGFAILLGHFLTKI